MAPEPPAKKRKQGRGASAEVQTAPEEKGGQANAGKGKDAGGKAQDGKKNKDGKGSGGPNTEDEKTNAVPPSSATKQIEARVAQVKEEALKLNLEAPEDDGSTRSAMVNKWHYNLPKLPVAVKETWARVCALPGHPRQNDCTGVLSSTNTNNHWGGAIITTWPLCRSCSGHCRSNLVAWMVWINKTSCNGQLHRSRLRQNEAQELVARTMVFELDEQLQQVV